MNNLFGLPSFANISENQQFNKGSNARFINMNRHVVRKPLQCKRVERQIDTPITTLFYNNGKLVDDTGKTPVLLPIGKKKTKSPKDKKLKNFEKKIKKLERNVRMAKKKLEETKRRKLYEDNHAELIYRLRGSAGAEGSALAKGSSLRPLVFGVPSKHDPTKYDKVFARLMDWGVDPITARYLIMKTGGDLEKISAFLPTTTKKPRPPSSSARPVGRPRHRPGRKLTTKKKKKKKSTKNARKSTKGKKSPSPTDSWPSASWSEGGGKKRSRRRGRRRLRRRRRRRRRTRKR